MRIPKPFLPLEVEQDGLQYRAHVLGRTVTFGADSLPTSILANGKELLAGPVRLCGQEDGEPIVWDTNYPDNESESFIQRRADNEVVLCGAMATRRFMIDTAITMSYDGSMDFDVKLMTRGQTVAEVFGLQQSKPRRDVLEKLWLEIPLKREAAPMFSCYPNSDISLSDGTVITEGPTTYAGTVREADMALPFKAMIWLGGDDAGLGFYAESWQNWQPAEKQRVLEIVHDQDQLILRVHLLDSHPATWTEDPATGWTSYQPISFRFGLQATPVKAFPKQPYLHNGMHLDCFIKIKGNYQDFLLEEKDGKNRFDRLQEKGVTTLILHEKWNKSQNFFELSEYTEQQLKRIVSECHRRGIRVLTYFGYEMSVMSNVWSDREAETTVRNLEGKHNGGWHRVPYQRDYVVCYNSSWQEDFLQGVAHIMDTCHIDGVYLDSTANANLCTNLKHGCGWYDAEGKLQGTYPLRAVRSLFRRLYDIVESRGGMINVHSYGIINFLALPYIHLSWYGEDLQAGYCHGALNDFPLEHFRAAYTGRNMGVPVEFIAYENRPIWTFENAVAMSSIHGILPRPNDIEGPLDLMSGIWKVMDSFPVAQSEWHPYWTNGAEVSDERVKVSYYRYTAPDGQVMLLAFCANTSAKRVEGVTLKLAEPVSGWTVCAAGHELSEEEKTSGTLRLNAFDYLILLAR